MWDRADSIKVYLARTNLTDFCEYIFGWDVQPFQKDWHRAFETHDRLVIFASVEHGKSSHVSIAYPLWLIGRNSDIRIALVSNIGEQAEKFFGVVREMIEGDSEAAQRYRRVFPQVKRGTGVYKRWDSGAIIVDRLKVYPDYTMCAIGVGKSFLGARYDVIVFDDCLDFENTATDTQRNKVWNWLTSTALTRIVKGGKALFICTAWHIEDAAHRAAESGRWVVKRTPALTVLPNGEPDWENGVSAWPESWSMARLKQRFQEVGSTEFARQFLCVAVSDALSRFKESSIEFALTLGKEFRVTTSFHPERVVSPGKVLVLNNEPVFVGVDLSIRKAVHNALTALFILCVYPNLKRRILDVRSGHMDGEDILDALAKVRLDYPQVVGCYVEDNQAQEYLVQFARRRTDLPPIRGFTTTERKYHPEYGIPSLAVEMDQGLWIFPSKEREETGAVHPQIRKLIQGLRSWSPRDHTMDEVMAMWLAREACADMYGAQITTGGERYDFASPANKNFTTEERPYNNPRFF